MASKFFNVKTVVDGLTFHSKKEAARWMELKAQASSGLVSGLRRQVKYPLEVNGLLVCRYYADFVYTLPDGTEVVEDSKGKRTDVYRLKRNLMLACHGITILET